MTCIVCGSNETRRHWDDRVVACATCGLVRAADHYFGCEPRKVYDEWYFQGSEYANYTRERRALQRNFGRRVQFLRAIAPRARTLVEIGSGYGFFLELATRYWRATGIEVSDHAAAEARQRGLPCVRGDYLSPDVEPEPADIVCLWDAIEHLKEPKQVLEKAARNLQAGGLLAISTGDIGALLARVQRARWRLIHPPTHLWYFSSDTLVRLLRTVGFEVVKIRYPIYFRSLRTYLGGFAAYCPDRLGDVPVPLQTGDLMEVYAERT